MDTCRNLQVSRRWRSDRQTAERSLVLQFGKDYRAGSKVNIWECTLRYFFFYCFELFFMPLQTVRETTKFAWYHSRSLTQVAKTWPRITAEASGAYIIYSRSFFAILSCFHLVISNGCQDARTGVATADSRKFSQQHSSPRLCCLSLPMTEQELGTGGELCKCGGRL